MFLKGRGGEQLSLRYHVREDSLSSRSVRGLVLTTGALVAAAPINHPASRRVFHPKVDSSDAGATLPPLAAAAAVAVAVVVAAAAAAAVAVAVVVAAAAAAAAAALSALNLSMKLLRGPSWRCSSFGHGPPTLSADH